MQGNLESSGCGMCGLCVRVGGRISGEGGHRGWHGGGVGLNGVEVPGRREGVLDGTQYGTRYRTNYRYHVK